MLLDKLLVGQLLKKLHILSVTTKLATIVTKARLWPHHEEDESLTHVRTLFLEGPVQYATLPPYTFVFQLIQTRQFLPTKLFYTILTRPSGATFPFHPPNMQCRSCRCSLWMFSSLAVSGVISSRTVASGQSFRMSHSNVLNVRKFSCFYI